MKNLFAKTKKAVKDNKKNLILFGEIFVGGVVGAAVVVKVGNKIIKE